MLNANHPYERLTQSGVYELGHFVSARRQPEVLTEDELFTTREEHYANIFQRCFISPRGTATSRRDHRRPVSPDPPSHYIARACPGVSREAMVRRLEELKLARDGTWDWFVASGGITDDQVRQVLAEIPARMMDARAWALYRRDSHFSHQKHENERCIARASSQDYCV